MVNFKPQIVHRFSGTSGGAEFSLAAGVGGVGGAEFFLAGEPNQDVWGGGAGAGCDDEGGTFVAAGVAMGSLLLSV